MQAYILYTRSGKLKTRVRIPFAQQVFNNLKVDINFIMCVKNY